MIGGRHTATTNAAFDADLKQRDPRWGVRDVDDIVREAMPYRLALREVVEMPANNLSLVLVKSSCLTTTHGCSSGTRTDTPSS